MHDATTRQVKDAIIMLKTAHVSLQAASPFSAAPGVTPMMEQYQYLKAKAGDALLFFRMGDFYELFQDDAIVASKALNIALTARNKQQDDPIPMCGVPIHSAESYIDRLLQQDFKVAIAEQLEDPSQAEGLVKRDIVRVITPGTVISSTILAPKEYNFLASIAVTPGGAGFAYVHETQHNTMTHLNGLRLYSTGDFMVLDETTRRHLELTYSPVSQGRAGSLLAVIDCTLTAMGGRLLRQWLSQPLCQLQALQERQEAVAELVEQSSRRARLRQALDTLSDFERTLSRLALGTVTPRELIALCRSIGRLPAIEAELRACSSLVLTTLAAQWDSLRDLADLIANAIVDDPPATLRDGQVIRS